MAIKLTMLEDLSMIPIEYALILIFYRGTWDTPQSRKSKKLKKKWRVSTQVSGEYFTKEILKKIKQKLQYTYTNSFHPSFLYIPWKIVNNCTFFMPISHDIIISLNLNNSFCNIYKHKHLKIFFSANEARKQIVVIHRIHNSLH